MSIRIGMMGFGSIGRQFYRLATESEEVEISIVSDIGNPEILHYLLTQENDKMIDVSYSDNYLQNGRFRTRMIDGVLPGDVSWDAFDLDMVVDATGKFTTLAHMNSHLDAGAQRVVISSLPKDDIDRLVVCGVNESSIALGDKTISAGSSTLNALALFLKALESYKIESANMTAIHSYTSDQPLQDVAGSDFRRSRSAAENIIPNISRSEEWITKVFPELKGKICCNALNVPVQKGSMLDLTIAFEDHSVTIDDVNNAMIAASEANPQLIGVTEDPVVSSDVIGNSRSLVFDLGATLKAGSNMVKVLGWYDDGLCHAARIMDVINSYVALEGSKG